MRKWLIVGQIELWNSGTGGEVGTVQELGMALSQLRNRTAEHGFPVRARNPYDNAQAMPPRPIIVAMRFQLAIPWLGALPQSQPPLHQLLLG